MAEVVKMPRLSDTMTEGVIAAWHKKVGDKVKKGDVLADVETDKATMELESYKEGTILHLGAEEGGKLQVDDLLVIVGEEGEDISSLVSESGSDKPAAENKEEKPAEEAAAEPDEQKKESKENSGGGSAPVKDLSSIPEVVLMPRLSDTMTEGVIAAWSKNVGDKVSKGDVLAEIETDKATMDLESYREGVLLHQGAPAGEKIQVNDLLAIIGAEDFKIDEILAAAKSGGSAQPAAKEEKPETAEKAESKPEQVSGAKAQPSAQQPAQQEVVNEGRILASPLAKRMAEDKGIDLRYVKGSGDNGRIIKSDIDNYEPPAQAAPAPEAGEAKAPKADEAPKAQVAPFVGAGAEEGYTDTPNSQMRGVIAKRLGESKFMAPHFYLTISVNMDKAMKSRGAMNEVSPAKISFNDFVIKAVAMALQKHPAVNSSWMGDFIRTYKHIHIGMAVAIPEGLIVPVIRFANQKTLSQIAAEAKELGGKAKSKKLQPNEFSGNTFTISNLGMMDIDEFTAIINPPDSCILAVGTIKEEVYRKENGEFDVRNIMKMTLSCDHRSVDGAVGAAFLQTVKSYLENPMLMLI